MSNVLLQMDQFRQILSYLNIFIILWLCGQGGSYALQTCTPQANVTFNWNYDTLDSRLSTLWIFEGTPIMSKVEEDKAEDLNTTQFMGRIAEDKGSNAGLVIYNLNVADSGQYSVTVKFYTVGDFSASEELVVDSNSAPSEVNRSKEITVDGKQLDTDEAHVIGEPGLSFNFNINGACIPPPNINLEFKSVDGSTQTTSCKQIFECHKTYVEAGNLCVIVTVPGYDSDLRFPSTGFYEIQASDIPCKDRMECIVPATVVPISVAIIVTVVVLAVLKPCRR